MPEILLALDTSSPLLSVALQTADGTLREKSLKGFLSHAENLLPLMDELIREAGLPSLASVTSLLIGRGPGSFTGLRVGFATLKALQAARKRKCFGETAFEAIAGGIPPETNRTLSVCLDARRDKIYFQAFTSDGKRWTAADAPRVAGFDELKILLNENALLAGDALIRHQEKLQVTESMKIAPEDQWFPKAKTLLENYAGKSFVQAEIKELKTAEDFLPLYLRLSEPEEKARGKQQT